MKIVIQCCATKAKARRSFKIEGHQVKFVADPERFAADSENSEGFVGFRPDDLMPSSSITWREHLLAYNDRGDNSDGLLQAGSLYKPPAYQNLRNRAGAENLYILSAGWGLVRSDFLLPDYDITFSSQAKQRWKRRMRCDEYRDLAHLT
ncbi:MAG: hypothetical protein EXS37_11745 [Opitutus sp.]|nr:hypothetical protein [Opitutus sp.]